MRKMVKQEIKHLLYAFNGECDGIIARVKWNNAAKSRERITKCYSEINKLGEVTNIVIMLEFYQLKQEELSLAYEYEKKRHDQKEEQRLTREQMREEERAQREFERALQEADEEAKMYEKVLAKALYLFPGEKGCRCDPYFLFQAVYTRLSSFKYWNTRRPIDPVKLN